MNVIVCLYSKYSAKCKQFLDYVSQTPIDMKMLCADNEDVRQCIMRDDPKYRIQSLPSILVFHVTGKMQKYEGYEAFEYIDSLTKAMQYQPPPPEEPPQDTSGRGDSPSSSTAIQQHPVQPVSSSTISPPLEPPIQPSILTPPEVSKELPPELRDLQIPPEAQQAKINKKDVMSMAASMAKQREMEEEQSHPNPYARVKAAQEKIAENAVKM